MKLIDIVNDITKDVAHGWDVIVARVGLRLAKKLLLGYKKFLLNQNYPLGSLNYLTQLPSASDYTYGYLWSSEKGKFYKLTRELEYDESGFSTYLFTLYDLSQSADKVAPVLIEYNKNVIIDNDGNLIVRIDGDELKFIPTPIFHLIHSVEIYLGKDK